MDRLRRVLQKTLPRGWWDRIDLENASIRDYVCSAAQRTKKGERILDAGAGQSPYRSYFSEATYIAVDFADGDHSWDYSNLDTITRLENLPFPNNTFDCIICTQVLEHLQEPEQVLKELCRVARSGGRLILTAPLGFGEHQAPHDYFRFTRYGLRHLLVKSGWTVTEVKPRGGYFRYMAVMLMWMYIYFFPEQRPNWLKWLMAPLQCLAALLLIVIGAPVISALDFLDREKVITLGFAACCVRHSDDDTGVYNETVA
jgi:SAM-dependent methyltransferase